MELNIDGSFVVFCFAGRLCRIVVALLLLLLLVPRTCICVSISFKLLASCCLSVASVRSSNFFDVYVGTLNGDSFLCAIMTV